MLCTLQSMELRTRPMFHIQLQNTSSLSKLLLLEQDGAERPLTSPVDDIVVQT